MPIPQTINNELGQEILDMLRSSRLYDENDPVMVAFEQRARQLCKAEPSEGYIMLAAAAGLCGNIGAMRSRYAIAQNQNISVSQRLNYATILAHIGLFSESGALVEQWGEMSNSLYFSVSRAILALHYTCAARLFDKARLLKITYNAEEMHSFQLAHKVSLVMKEADLTDKDIASLADLAGEVMRDHRTSSIDMGGMTDYPGEDGLPCLCSTIYVPVSIDEASNMNFELAEKFSTSALEVSINRYSIRFVGTHECNA